jgi:hypothetical protein
MRVFALLRPPFPVDNERVGELLEIAGNAMELVEGGVTGEPLDQALVVITIAFDELQDLGYVVYWEY